MTHTGATSGLVYVTATDPEGLADQVAFALKINDRRARPPWSAVGLTAMR